MAVNKLQTTDKLFATSGAINSMAVHTDIANRIAKCAIDHYDNNIPSNGGKPQIGREWTVYAAIVACKNSSISINNDDDANDMWVVSCATGSYCDCIVSST